MIFRNHSNMLICEQINAGLLNNSFQTNFIVWRCHKKHDITMLMCKEHGKTIESKIFELSFLFFLQLFERDLRRFARLERGKLLDNHVLYDKATVWHPPPPHTHTLSHSHTLSLTHTHTHAYLFRYTCGDSHRRNGFSTVQTVYSIALHQPYT